jgi:hypothetical protein
MPKNYGVLYINLDISENKKDQCYAENSYGQQLMQVKVLHELRVKEKWRHDVIKLFTALL